MGVLVDSLKKIIKSIGKCIYENQAKEYFLDLLLK
jgi:hypothetical protein